MPLYEYHCDECGVRFERQQRFSDEPVRVCPECGGSVHRVIGSTGVIFKGKGFYVTDNRKSRSRAAGKSTDGSKEDGESKEGKAGKASKGSQATKSEASDGK